MALKPLVDLDAAFSSSTLGQRAAISADDIVPDGYDDNNFSATPVSLPQMTSRPLWPVAAPFRPRLEPFATILDAEFNASGLRDLARFYDIKLKGTLKSALLEQIIAGINDRLTQSRTNPEALFAGVSEEQSGVLRKLFTAWDPELPFARSIVKAFLGSIDEKRITELLEWLRKHALIFPARSYSYYISLRDAYYQLLPLGPAASHVPGIVWGDELLSSQPPSAASLGAAAPPLLEAIDRWLDAAHSGAVMARLPLSPHPKTAQTNWLQRWEHDSDEAERIFKSRPGWVPDSRSGITVPLLAMITSEATQNLETQTGLSAGLCEWLVPLLGALQIIVPPTLASGTSPATTLPCVLVSTPGFEMWLGLTPEQRLRRAWIAWLEQTVDGMETVHTERRLALRSGTSFKVMRGIGAQDFSPAHLAAEWCGLRRYLARALRGLPTRVWISWPLFRATLFSLRPSAAHTLKTIDDWWFARPDGAKIVDAKLEDWLRTTGAILETMLTTALSWFGAVECALGHDGTLIQFRVTVTGVWLLTNKEADLPASAVPKQKAEEPLTWQGELTWRVPPAPSRIDFIALSRKLGEPAGQPFTYRLTNQSVEHALAQGVSMDLVHAQFERFGIPLTPAARALIAEIVGHFGRLRVYEALTILELADDLTLRELLASTSIARAIVFQLSPRVVVIRDDAVDTLVSEMVARGHTPQVTGEKK